MEGKRAYTKRDWRQAVNASAFFGWLLISAPFVFQVGIGLIPWVAAIGLPIAFISCWVIAAPMLWYAMRKPISWLLAVAWGATISATMAVVYIVASRLNGLRISQDPTYDFQLGGGKFIREIDGILTPYGWWVLLQNTALFIIFGVLVGLLIRAIIGSGQKHSGK